MKIPPRKFDGYHRAVARIEAERADGYAALQKLFALYQTLEDSGTATDEQRSVVLELEGRLRGLGINVREQLGEKYPKVLL